MSDSSTNNGKSWSDIIRAVKTPLSFFTLAVLVLGGILGALASRASGSDFTLLLVVVLVALVVVFALVTYFTLKKPDVLVGTKQGTATEPLPTGLRSVGKEQLTEVAHGQLIIKCAKYGMQNTWDDVTSVLESMISGGKLQLDKRYNDLFGDPVVQKRKQLRIDYLHGGREISITVPEDTKLTLPLMLFRSP